MKFSVLAIVAILACGKSKQDGASRPAVVTEEMATTFEAYVAAFEKLTTDIENAGADCKAVLVVVQRETKDVIALAPRGDKLHDAMAGLKGDPAATEWFALTFTPRMQTASRKLIPLESHCGQDAELHSALDDAMSRFPMLRKKS